MAPCQNPDFEETMLVENAVLPASKHVTFDMEFVTIDLESETSDSRSPTPQPILAVSAEEGEKETSEPAPNIGCNNDSEPEPTEDARECSEIDLYLMGYFMALVMFGLPALLLILILRFFA